MRPVALSLLVGLSLAAGVMACASSPPLASPAAPSYQLPDGAVTIEVTARGSRFDTAQLTVPADAPFAIRLRNDDREPHNIEIRDAAGNRLFVGESFSGPAESLEVLPALRAGSYAFLCSAHPYMKGSLLAE